MSANILKALPLLHVSSSANAEAFYCGQLGFMLESTYRPHPPAPDPGFLSVVRDGVHLHLSSFADDGGFGGVVAFAVRDVDALYAEFQARGIPIALPPTDQTWGNREMYIRDPDGNALRFLQPL